MKVKELIEKLQEFNPDGVVEVEVIQSVKFSLVGKVMEVEDTACAMINPVIIAKP